MRFQTSIHSVCRAAYPGQRKLIGKAREQVSRGSTIKPQSVLECNRFSDLLSMLRRKTANAISSESCKLFERIQANLADRGDESVVELPRKSSALPKEREAQTAFMLEQWHRAFMLTYVYHSLDQYYMPGGGGTCLGQRCTNNDVYMLLTAL